MAQILASVARVGGCFIVLPGLSSARIPAPARIYITLAVALIIALSRGSSPVATVPDAASLLRLVGAEMAVGLAIGLSVRFAMLALSFAATTIASVIGFNNLFGQGVEENESQASFTTLVTFSALMILFQLEFHHEVVRALHGSYAVIPAGTIPDPAIVLEDMTLLLSTLFHFVMGLAAPFLVYALVFNTAIGVLNKLTPQIPVFFVSLPALIAGGLLLSWFVVPDMLRLFGAQVLSGPAFR